jgi:hypothetical protein
MPFGCAGGESKFRLRLQIPLVTRPIFLSWKKLTAKLGSYHGRPLGFHSQAEFSSFSVLFWRAKKLLRGPTIPRKARLFNCQDSFFSRIKSSSSDERKKRAVGPHLIYSREQVPPGLASETWENTNLRSLSLPWSENPDLHPTDEDLSVGTPDLGHPFILGWSILGHPPAVTLPVFLH